MITFADIDIHTVQCILIDHHVHKIDAVKNHELSRETKRSHWHRNIHIPPMLLFCSSRPFASTSSSFRKSFGSIKSRSQTLKFQHIAQHCSDEAIPHSISSLEKKPPGMAAAVSAITNTNPRNELQRFCSVFRPVFMVRREDQVMHVLRTMIMTLPALIVRAMSGI